ncbi:TonB-dependent receptor [Fretibacter rubidus]|uniref:TonB-dependent receptor n=1 Tax=Fretibacter rubidus TaxID=570162 RepID=UPI00352B483D
MSPRHLLSASAMALFMVVGATSASAQSAIDTLTDEIIVTATKKANAENVQDIPIAITAFNADTLDALNVTDLESLSFSAPNVSLDDMGTSRGTANFSIRGLGINSSIPSIDPTVGVFVDGVYLGVNNAVVTDLFDLDSVEVLRGPQGLLFGRNTTGGAVLINTGNPTSELTYSAKVSTETPVDSGRGGLNSYIQGVVSGPLIEDRLNGKIAAFYNKDDGYFKNLATGNNFGEADTFIGRGALEFFASDNVTFLLKGEYFDSEGDGPAGQNRGVFDRNSFDFAIDEEGGYETKALTASLRTDIDVDFGNGTITNIFGYRDLDLTSTGDIDSLPVFIFHSDTEMVQDQISNELRYAGEFDYFDLTAGLYYFDQSSAYTEIRNLPPLSPLTFYGGGAQDHTVYGAFAQADIPLTEFISATVGLRYSKEEKDGDITFIRPRNECSVVDGTCPTSGINALLSAVTGGLAQEPNGFSDSNSWENLTPKLGLQFTPSDDVQVYGSYTKGFRSGGYNFRITDVPLYFTQLGLTGQPSFDEEEVDAYEAGFKSEFMDGVFQLNGAFFITKIADMQREVNISGGPASVNQFILNTADATISGFEADGRARVTDNLLLTANLGYVDAGYDDVRFDISNDGVLNAADSALDLPRVPEWTYGFGIVHTADLGDNGGLTSTLNFQHRDRTAYTDSNLGWLNAVNMLNGNISWETPMEGVSLSIFGKNLLDEVQAGGDTQLSFGAGLTQALTGGAPLPPGGSNRATGVVQPFADNPTVGTFSPLKKGRRLGIEITIRG